MFAFESKVWQDTIDHAILLDKVYRQTDMHETFSETVIIMCTLMAAPGFVSALNSL